MNPFADLARALDEARQVQRAVENQGNSMLDLLAGNLRSLSPYRLERLKRELRDFNMTTKRWK